MKNHLFNRRAFLRYSMLGTLALAGCSTLESLGLTLTQDDALPEVTLGNTGIRSTLVGVGTGTNGVGGASNQTRLGEEPMISLLEYAYDQGIRYFDLADQYGSHPYMKQALKENGGTIPRDRVMLLTKTHAKTADEMRADLDRFRREVGTEYFDVILLHCKTKAGWSQSHAGAMEALAEAREQGIIRAHGVSCHSFAALEEAARTPWVQVDLARYNPWGEMMDSSVENVKPVLERMVAAGKGVIGMKVFGGGKRISPEDRVEGLEHAVASPLLHQFTVGVESREQVDELLKLTSAALKIYPRA